MAGAQRPARRIQTTAVRYSGAERVPHVRANSTAARAATGKSSDYHTVVAAHARVLCRVWPHTFRGEDDAICGPNVLGQEGGDGYAATKGGGSNPGECTMLAC